MAKKSIINIVNIVSIAYSFTIKINQNYTSCLYYLLQFFLIFEIATCNNTLRNRVDTFLNKNPDITLNINAHPESCFIFHIMNRFLNISSNFSSTLKKVPYGHLD